MGQHLPRPSVELYVLFMSSHLTSLGATGDQLSAFLMIASQTTWKYGPRDMIPWGRDSNTTSLGPRFRSFKIEALLLKCYLHSLVSRAECGTGFSSPSPYVTVPSHPILEFLKNGWDSCQVRSPLQAPGAN